MPKNRKNKIRECLGGCGLKKKVRWIGSSWKWCRKCYLDKIIGRSSKGKKLSLDTIQKRTKTRTKNAIKRGYWVSKETARKRSKTMISKFKNCDIWNKGKSMYSNCNGDKQKIKKRFDIYSNAGKKRWANITDDQRMQMFKKSLKKAQERPNFRERQLDRILNDLFPGEYKYVGNWEFIIAGKNPDFININGQKKIIEFYGNIWHSPEEEPKRIKLFKKYGYKTLVIWGKDLRDISKLNKRLTQFNQLKRR